MATTTYTVKGMTCEHCVRSVTEELTALEGVQDVQVDLGSGRVDVTSDQPLPAEAVTAAVEEAGFSVA